MTESRIEKLRTYLFNVINGLTDDRDYQISADFLGDIGNFSLDKIPTRSTVQKWIIGIETHRDVYSFKSRMAYSQDTLNNLKNIGFFEDFENKIKSNNENGVLPEIEGIESIECLNCGTINVVDTDSAIFNIQIQIIYRYDPNKIIISL